MGSVAVKAAGTFYRAEMAAKLTGTLPEAVLAAGIAGAHRDERTIGGANFMAAGPTKLAIGLPVYNGEHYLARSIESILSQTFGDFVLIISDNASTDRTAEICHEFTRRDKRVHYNRSPVNLGAAPNFNRVWELAQPWRPTYFKWQASDDLLEPTYLERCVGLLDQTPDAVLAHSRATIIDGDGHELIAGDADQYPGVFPPPNGRPRVIAPQMRTLDIIDPPRRTDDPDVAVRMQDILVLTRWCFEQFGVMRNEAIRRSTLHFGFYGSDKVLMVSLGLQGRFLELPDPLFLRRHHSGQSSEKPHEEVAIWMDSSGGRKTRRPPPQLECFKWYLWLIARSGYGPGTQLRCYGEVVRWIGWLATLIYRERHERGFLFRLKTSIRKNIIG